MPPWVVDARRGFPKFDSGELVVGTCLSRTGIFHVLFTFIFTALTLVVIIQGLFQLQAYTPYQLFRLLILFQTLKKIDKRVYSVS